MSFIEFGFDSIIYIDIIEIIEAIDSIDAIDHIGATILQIT